MRTDLTGRVAVVTGAGAGLGRAHALRLAQHGAKVVVNDLRADAAETVAAEITGRGGAAFAFAGSVTDLAAVGDLFEGTFARWGAVDILVNNAGILRDRTFAKMSLDDFRLIVDVHLMGSVNCTKAVWERMRERRYGRIVMTGSSSGLYGNFGQSNYGAAKMALVGLTKTLALEGEKYNVRVNCLAPTAATEMLEGLLPAEQLARLSPELVSPGVVALVCDEAPNGVILCAGGGGFEQAHITLTRGIVAADPDTAAEHIAGDWTRLADTSEQLLPQRGFEQAAFELGKLTSVAAA